MRRIFFVFITALFSIFLLGCQENKPTSPSASQTIGRNHFTASTTMIIDRYNHAAAKTHLAIVLPQWNSFEKLDSTENNVFFSLMYKLRQGFFITFEIDKISGNPFSINVLTVPITQQEQMMSFGMLLSAGYAIFGNENPEILKDTCLKISKKQPSVSTMQNGMNITCSVVAGALIASISVPEEIHQGNAQNQ